MIFFYYCVKCEKRFKSNIFAVYSLKGFPLRGGSIGCDRGVACIILVYQHGFSKLRGRSGRYSSRQHDDLTFLSPQLWHLLRNVEAIPRYFYRTVHQTSDKEEFNANGECV